MICIFCGRPHEAVTYMCEARQAAMIRRVVLLSTRVPKKVQTTIPEIYRKLANKETFIVNKLPIAILDSDEENDIPLLIDPTDNDLPVKRHRQPTSIPEHDITPAPNSDNATVITGFYNFINLIFDLFNKLIY